MMNKTVIDITTRTCGWCSKQGTVQVMEDDFWSWKNKTKLAQEAFPYLSAPLREQVITGTHPECWNEMFGDPFNV